MEKRITRGITGMSLVEEGVVLGDGNVANGEGTGTLLGESERGKREVREKEDSNRMRKVPGEACSRTWVASKRETKPQMQPEVQRLTRWR